jgi:hypothetical protein
MTSKRMETGYKDMHDLTAETENRSFEVIRGWL